MLDLFWLAVFTLALWLGLGGWWAVGIAGMRRLGRRTVPDPDRWPAVAIVVPARDEAQGIEAAMRTILALDYPAFEVVAVDDRSTDGTGAILDRLADQDPRLRVIHVEDLPGGWLGKTHAMQAAADRSAAPWLLFTDADVHFERDALREAMAFALHRGRDHLAGLPRFVARGPLVGSFMHAFALLFGMYTRMWSASDPRSAAAIGIGAFGLVRREAYLRAGTHRAVRMSPDDDLALGRRLKASGAAQEAVFVADHVAVEWYPNVRAAVRGMRKNAFAGFGFSLPLAGGVVLALLATHVVPYVAIFTATGATRAVYAAILLTIAAVYLWNRRAAGTSPFYALLHPVGVAFLCAAVVASIVHIRRRGGIEWRGTLYRIDGRKGADVQGESVSGAETHRRGPQDASRGRSRIGLRDEERDESHEGSEGSRREGATDMRRDEGGRSR